MGDEGDAAAFFAALDPGQALAVALARAGEVGARAGVPFELRFAANRHLVRLAHAEAVRVGDGAAANRYTKLLADDRQLLLFDPRGHGKIAEVRGDLATAETVVIMVPGTGSSLATFAGGPSRDQRAIHNAAHHVTGGKVATIMWIGSDLPQSLPAAALRVYAQDAAPKLRAFVEDLRLAGNVRTTLIGHSYGSTVTGHAVQAGLGVDNLIAVGSPGWGVTLAGELNAPHTSLYAMRHPDDVISLIPPLDDVVKSMGIAPPTSVLGHGSDPVFMPGVTRMSSGTDDNLLPIGGDLEAHSSYFGDEGRSRLPTMNIAEIVAGGRPVRFGEAEDTR
ncbi:alpha/beta hydrolase [Herbidospora yilanensis]|uniref:alpha/beta hydrolase n=1 Tax=Herbidospora yilanensis TaxID=354426 RepID=UPI000783F746|nr:alpha/beta hydrolase [Herbidospora yilanensis]